MGAPIALLLLLAAGPAPPANPTGPPEVATAQATGTLTAVNDGELTITRGDATLRFRLDATTRVFVGGDLGAAAGLTTGGRVRVEYVRDDPEPHLARRVLDDQSIVIFTAERNGVAAKLLAVEQRPVDDAPVTVVTVETEHGKRRELVVRTEEPQRSVVLKDGEPAEPGAFAAGDAVMVSLRRTSGATLYLRALADPPTYFAFCAMMTLEGTVSAVEADGRLQVTVPGRDTPQTVRTTRNTTFYKAGARAAQQPFVAGDAVVVKYTRTAQGQLVARALFDRASWRAYAQDAAAQPPAGGEQR